MKKISTKQLEAVLQVIYQTNISARSFDRIEELFSQLEDCKEEVKEETK